ncbi:MAG: DUF697 domain-containing protein [Candidatus Scalindua sp.]|nr:DUF697 domain-containing protein [Candidatus Scalindua sp.]
MDKKDITNDSNAKKKTKIKVKRSRRRMYESVQDDEKSTVTSEKEEKQRGNENEQDLINERKEDEDNRLLQANEIVAYHVQWSLGLGLVPIPLIDAVAILITQVRMLKKLSDHYGIACSENHVKILVTSLIGGTNSGLIGGKFLISMTKLVPGIGTFIGITAMSALSGSITYAVGQVFIQHFESGGTFLDFDPKKVKEYFMTKFEEGKKGR